MNNDTPQVFGEDAHDYAPDADSCGAHEGETFTAFRGWAGWGDRVEPVAPDDDYPAPSFSPYAPASYEPEYPQRPGPVDVIPGNRVTRRVPATRPIRATRAAGATRRTREKTVTRAMRRT